MKKKLDEKVYPTVDDLKLRQSLMLMADRYNEKARKIIHDTYNDKKLLLKWQKVRDSGVYEKGGGKAHHRKIVEFPNTEVFDFVDHVMTISYGEDWLYEDRALKHELVKPWCVVKKI